MEDYLKKLLGALDKSYPESLLTLGELRQKVSDLHQIQVSDDLIHEAISRELIFYPPYKPNSSLGADDSIGLGIKGFELLNQIRIKEALGQLDDSIKKFNKSSDKASYTITILTLAMTILTVVIVIITGVQVATALNWI